MIGPNFNRMGECKDSYQGILCSNCKSGFSRSNSFECQKCPNKTANGFKIFGLFIIFAIVILLMLKSTLEGASEKRNITAVFQKILLNHI